MEAAHPPSTSAYVAEAGVAVGVLAGVVGVGIVGGCVQTEAVVAVMGMVMAVM